MLVISPTVSIPDAELVETFTRSPGPGGQNVNKVETGVQLRWNARESTAISGAVYMRLQRIAGRRLTADGVLVITSHRTRSQDRNRQDARDKLVALVCEALAPPRYRKASRPPRASRLKRLDTKHRRSTIKKGRRRADPDD